MMNIVLRVYNLSSNKNFINAMKKSLEICLIIIGKKGNLIRNLEKFQKKECTFSYISF